MNLNLILHVSELVEFPRFGLGFSIVHFYLCLVSSQFSVKLGQSEAIYNMSLFFHSLSPQGLEG